MSNELPIGIEMRRRLYAEEIQAVCGLENELLASAFAAVPREDFLGPGPWRIVRPDVLPGAPIAYRESPDADPRHLYHDVLVAIDPARSLNNGQPTALARWLDALALRPGARAVHIGCGVGYYTAVMAEIVGPDGRVTAVENDGDLCVRARDNLTRWPQVEVICGDGASVETGDFDAALVNAGATRLARGWLDRIAAGGRLLVPLTVDMTPGGAGSGLMLLVERLPEGHAARVVSPVSIFPCQSARDPTSEARVRQMLMTGAWQRIRRLRRDPHPLAETCLLHEDDYCLDG